MEVCVLGGGVSFHQDKFLHSTLEVAQLRKFFHMDLE